MVESIGDYWMQLQKLMDEVGWAIQGVGAGAELPGYPRPIPQFAYTVGLSKWEHPEIVMVGGLPFDTMKMILNTVGARVRDGERFQPGQRYSEIIASAPSPLALELTVGFRTCSNYDMNSTKHFFGEEFPALQLLWPDKLNRLPGEVGYDDRRFVQPLWP